MLVALVAAASQVSADTGGGNKGEQAGPQQTLKQKSLDPTSDLKRFQLQNRVIPNTFEADGYANLLTTRIWYPIPKSQAFPIRQVWRATFPILTAPGGPTGLSDIRVFDLFVLGEGRLGGGQW